MNAKGAGPVTLVGAGPGPADLMTVRAQRTVQGAQALLYDALVSPEVVALAPAECLKILTGKRGGQASMSQGEINRLMLTLAQRGLDVVRLKGGDPSVFGRSGEEAAFLAAHGVRVEIVPGVTAASAAAAQFGFPLTHRHQARRLVLATARVENGALAACDSAALVDPQATLALYMARDRLAEIAAALIAAGRGRETPALAVENAGHAHARAVRGELDGIARAVGLERFSGPVVMIVGDVAAFAPDPPVSGATAEGVAGHAVGHRLEDDSDGAPKPRLDARSGHLAIDPEQRRRLGPDPLWRLLDASDPS